MRGNIQVLETGNQRMVSLDLQSKLLQDNIIMIADEIDTESVTDYQTQLFYLMSKLQSGDIITLYINSPGGSVLDGLGLYDTIQLIKQKGIIIRTVNVGSACSMASIILMSGSEGYRESTANSSVLIHEVSAWWMGKTPDLLDQAEEIKRLQTVLDGIISKHSDSKLIELCKRKDLWLNAEDALKYHIIDKIL